AVIANDNWNREPNLAPQKDRYTTRLPPARLGTRLKADFDESLKVEIEYNRVFKQDNISKIEQVTSGYNMLNMTLAYK
ncbi:hypothetical protein, partial [Acinetobacter baumannii]|uniref:hypothetical protein n=1 Tax=Acinetobacter baumannii TaxID=470 RepID=UPI003D6B218F